MMGRKVPCEPSQDVYALAHLVLLTFSKEDIKSHNMWVSTVGAAGGNDCYFRHPCCCSLNKGIDSGV